MSITPQFMTAVNNGDITYVRVMLKNEILLSAESGCSRKCLHMLVLI